MTLQQRTCMVSSTYIHAYIHTHIHTYTHTYTHIHIHTHSGAPFSQSLLFPWHTHTRTYIHTYTHTYTHIHTHTHIHTQWSPFLTVTTLPMECLDKQLFEFVSACLCKQAYAQRVCMYVCCLYVYNVFMFFRTRFGLSVQAGVCAEGMYVCVLFVCV